MGGEADAAGVTIDWEAFGGMMGRLTVHDVVVDRVRSLRDEGYRTALCTNNVKEGSQSWRELVPADDLFDTVVDSSAVGLRKPDPRIYLHTLSLRGRQPRSGPSSSTTTPATWSALNGLGSPACSSPTPSRPSPRSTSSSPTDRR